jgi:hypothetical protein
VKGLTYFQSKNEFNKNKVDNKNVKRRNPKPLKNEPMDYPAKNLRFSEKRDEDKVILLRIPLLFSNIFVYFNLFLKIF